MMPLTEIDRLVRSADESGRSPVADAVAARWGHPAGVARRWRSSASHVFVLSGACGPPAGFLRFVPAHLRSRDQLAVVARLMRTLAERGVELAAPIPSMGGELVEAVDTDLGLMHAMCVAAAPGRYVQDTELTLAQAHAWGCALARLHRCAAGLGAALPEAWSELHHAADHLAHDPALVAAVRRLVDKLAALPRDLARYGVIHGDFELDNLAWVGDMPTSFDFDEAARGWFAADIANAVRDLAPRGVPGRQQQAHFDAFVAGYRSHRPLPAADLASLPLFTAAATAVRLIRLHAALDTAGGDGPDALATLRAKLATAMADMHQTVVTTLL